MMGFIPSKKFNLTSKLPPYEMKQRLDQILFSIQKWTREKGRAPFLGFRNGDTFIFFRTNQYYNLFAPVLWGVLQEEDGCTGIQVTIGLRNAAKWFMRVWLVLFVIFLSLIFLHSGGPVSTTSLLCAIVGYLAVHAVFWSETIQLKAILEAMISPDFHPKPTEAG